MSPVSFGGDGVIVGHRVADFGFENVEPGAEDGVVHHERGEDLDHLVIGAARFDDQPGVEAGGGHGTGQLARSEEHTSELQSLMRNSYAVFCLKKQTTTNMNKK